MISPFIPIFILSIAAHAIIAALSVHNSLGGAMKEKFISLAKKKGFFKSGIDHFDSNSVDRFVSKHTKSEDLIFDFVTYWGGGEVEI